MKAGVRSIVALLLVLCSVACPSCTKEDSDLTGGGDELGISCDGSLDAYGVQIWTPEEIVLTTLYSRIDTLSQSPIKSKEVLYYALNGEESSVQWNSSARIIKAETWKNWVGAEYGYRCSSTILYDLSEISDAVTVEALITTNGRVVRRFQTIPVRREEMRCDIFAYSFGETLDQLSDYIFPHPLNTDNLKVVRQRGWDSPVALLRFSDAPTQRVETIYCVGDRSVLGVANLLESACERCRIPQRPEFEIPVGERLRIQNPQQWEFNGLRFSLYNTTWQELGVVWDGVTDDEFACLAIEKY